MPPSSSELISAVGHPLRRQILNAYLGGAVECPSARQLAEALDQRVGQIAYHLKALARDDILRPVQSGQGQRAQELHYGWTLGVEAERLRLVLAVWADSELSR